MRLAFTSRDINPLLVKYWPTLGLDPGSEVSELFAGQWNIHKLGSQDSLKTEEKFRERGLSRLEEQVFSLPRRQ